VLFIQNNGIMTTHRMEYEITEEKVCLRSETGTTDQIGCNSYLSLHDGKARYFDQSFFLNYCLIDCTRPFIMFSQATAAGILELYVLFTSSTLLITFICKNIVVML